MTRDSIATTRKVHVATSTYKLSVHASITLQRYYVSLVEHVTYSLHRVQLLELGSKSKRVKMGKATGAHAYMGWYWSLNLNVKVKEHALHLVTKQVQLKFWVGMFAVTELTCLYNYTYVLNQR